MFISFVIAGRWFLHLLDEVELGWVGTWCHHIGFALQLLLMNHGTDE